MKTIRGIFNNIDESDYVYNIDGLTFFFSSNLYKEKFIKGLKDYLFYEQLKLKQKYNVNCNFDLYFMISFYKKIEKRGFKIIENTTKKQLNKDIYILNKII